MEETNVKKDFLTTFSKAKQVMIATNDSAYSEGKYSFRYNHETVRDYSMEEIEKILSSGSLDQQKTLSLNYYYKDGYYKQILTYYATLLKYAGLLIPNPSFGKNLSSPHIKKRYDQALDYVEKMNLSSFLTNCTLKSLINGCYFGLILKLDKNSFTVLDLPSKYCRTRFKDEYGNDLIEFDVSYFNSITDESLRKGVLSLYPQEIRTGYYNYKKGGIRWVVMPNGSGICFPFLDGSGRPPFLSIIPATLRYDDALDTDRERDLEEIKKIIVQQIPHLPDGRLLFEPEEAAEIHAGTVGMMKKNPNVSILTTYADVDAIQSQTTSDASKTSNLNSILNNVYSRTGVSKEIFSSTGSSTLPTSLKKDLALMMFMANKYSIFITNIINSLYQNSNITFKYTILPISYFNEDEYVDNAFKLASSGYSFLLPAIAMGISQKDLSNLKDLENDVLKLGEKLIPLTSAYTQSNTGEVGRPKKADEDKAEQTIANEKSKDNVAAKGDSE